MPLTSVPCYRFKSEKNYSLKCMEGHHFRDWIMTCEEACTTSRKTHYSLLKTEDEVVGSKSPWESITQPGSDPRFPHPSPACRSPQLNTTWSSSPTCCCFFLTKLAFAASYNTSTVGAAKSSGTFKKTCTVKYSAGRPLLFIASLGLKNSARINSSVRFTLCWDTVPTIIWVN